MLPYLYKGWRYQVPTSLEPDINLMVELFSDKVNAASEIIMICETNVLSWYFISSPHFFSDLAILWTTFIIFNTLLYKEAFSGCFYQIFSNSSGWSIVQDEAST